MVIDFFHLGAKSISILCKFVDNQLNSKMNQNSQISARRFQREVIFTKLPMNFGFSYLDVFQLFPANLKGLPKTKIAHPHHPMILEYWYTDDELEKVSVDEMYEGLEDIHRLTSVTCNKKDLIMSLLSIVSTHQFFQYSSRDARWGFPILKDDAGTETNTWSSKWCLAWFHWPERPEQLKISEFTSIELELSNFIPWETYYQRPTFDWNLEGKVFLPTLIKAFLDAYFAKDSQTRKSLDSAIASSNTAMEFMSSRKKLAVLSAFTAIETMVELDSKDFVPSKCKECGQDIYKIAARYRSFLLKYIGDSEANKKKFNSYYSLRSKIVHAGQDFQTEKLFSEVDQGIKNKEHLQMAEIVILSKLAIVFWVIKN